MKYIVPVSITFNIQVNADDESEAQELAELQMENIDTSKLPKDNFVQYGEASTVEEEIDEDEDFVSGYKKSMSDLEEDEDND